MPSANAVRFIFFIILASALWGDTAEKSDRWWPSLEARNLQDEPIQWSGRWLVVVFLDSECPIANGYVPVINQLAREFSPKKVQFLGVYCDPFTKLEPLLHHVFEYNVNFPVCWDRYGRLQRAAGASYASETSVLDAYGKVIYRGRIDDRVDRNGRMRPRTTQHDLLSVLMRLCDGESGPFRDEPGFGCTLPEAKAR